MLVASAPATDRIETGVFLLIGIGLITTWWDPWCGRSGSLSTVVLLAPWNGPLTLGTCDFRTREVCHVLCDGLHGPRLPSAH